MSARRVLALVCALCLVAAAGTVLADDDKEHSEKSGYLGVHLQNIDSSMAKALQLDEDGGVLISEVVDESPAATAGLEDGDVVLEFDGRSIDDIGDLTRAVRRAEPGETVEVVVLRAGERRSLDVEIGERENVFAWISGDGDSAWTIRGGDLHLEDFHDDHARVMIKRMKDGDDVNVWVTGFDSDRGYLGVHLDDLNEQLGDYFGVEDGEGALVTSVIEDSGAEKAGLMAGDIIVRIGDEDVESAADVSSAMQHTEVGEELEVTVVRKGRTETFTVELGEMSKEFFGKNIEFFDDDDHYRIVGPKMLRSMPHMKGQMYMHDPGHIEIIREIEDDDEELEEVREELEKLREELKEVQEELDKR
jgi:serine protease Do